MNSARSACPKCGSSDGLAEYADGHYCFACNSHIKTDGKVRITEDNDKALPMITKGHFEALRDRGISEETCKFAGYNTAEYKDQQVQVANYRDEKGVRIAQKVRLPGKDFLMLGDGKHAPLYLQHLWGSGKFLTITEGEIDALSYLEAFKRKWPVVSLSRGAQFADKELGKHLDWLNGFEHIVLSFDMDKAGREAVDKAVKVLPPGKIKLVNLGRKDANEVLVQDGAAALVDAFWKAKDWRPDGIVAGSELTRERLKTTNAVGFPLPYPLLQERLMGLRKQEITLLSAGTGIGKSTLARELAYWLHQGGLNIGNVFLEEGIDKSAQAYVAIHNNVNLKNLRADPNILSDEDWDRSLKEIIHDRMYFYDHFGSLDGKQLLLKLRYLATVAKVDFIVLDHISIVVSGNESDQGERKDIDVFMTNLRSLVEETGVGVIAIVHLKRPEGVSHEEGGRVTLAQLRGSGALAQLSDNVIALERDQQAGE